MSAFCFVLDAGLDVLVNNLKHKEPFKYRLEQRGMGQGLQNCLMKRNHTLFYALANTLSPNYQDKL